MPAATESLKSSLFIPGLARANTGRFAAAAVICLALAALPLPAWAEAGELDRDCVLDLAERADGSMTLDELRQACWVDTAEPAERDRGYGDPVAGAEPGEPAVETSPGPGLVQRRLDADRDAATRPFSVIAHRPNYFLAAVYNIEGWNPEAQFQDDGQGVYANDDLEAQFQVSLKVPLAVGLLGDRLDVYGAYTNRSFWQVYDRENSEPFRETNHEPELWLQSRNDWKILGFTNSVNSVGWVHQSNGRAGALSRSWNRVYATFVFERDHWALAFKPWYWISTGSAEIDNPDIDDYMGHGEFRAVYGRNGHVISAMLRNQLESGFDRGAVELSWSFPFFGYPYLRGYLQYFYGYGESLIDYDNRVNRLGIGISVTDWLE